MRMWLSKKAMETKEERSADCTAGIVTIGGQLPCVMTEGEIRNAERLSCGAAYIPAAGDTVLVIRTAEGECLVAGRIEGQKAVELAPGEVYITNKSGNASICLKNSGEVLINAACLKINGRMEVQGKVYINGKPVV